MFNDTKIIQKIKNDDISSYKELFDSFYLKLLKYSMRFVSMKEIAEELVQDLFIHIWDNRKNLMIQTSLESYLFASVKNRSLNYLKSKYAGKDYVELSNLYIHPQSKSIDQEIEAFELELLIQKAVNSLPPKCGTVFNLSRNAGMTYQEIAEELNIGKETVKTQIGIALMKIREYLGKYWEEIPV